MDRVMSLNKRDTSRLLKAALDEFTPTHPDLRDVLTEHYERAAERTQISCELGAEQRLLMGAYFTMEYAFESAALFNPSIVLSTDQSGIGPGEARFVMSLRSVGEGHISSIVFRSGTVARDGDIHVDPAGLQIRRMRVVEDRQYDKDLFRIKIIEIGAYRPVVEAVLERLDARFTMQQLIQAIHAVQFDGEVPLEFREVADSLTWLAGSNYQIRWDPDGGLGELILFPTSETESQGMEDMRLVRFVDDDGSVRYYGTYTAVSGHRILPQILEVAEPGVAEIHTLNGRYAQNKGMALFPRKLDGWYVMITRVDGENLYLARSKNVRFWNDAVRLQEPKFPWEFVQIGNCGSPIETEAGWLLLTHGVGPMRRYCIGASLLDLHDPARLIGRLDTPLLVPNEEERSGYVPNVVYSCGGMVHNELLVIPYGISYAATGFAVVPLDDVLSRLRP